MEKDTSGTIRRAERFQMILIGEGMMIGGIAGLVIVLYRIVLECAGIWLDRILDQSVIGERYLPQLQELISALDRFHPLSPDLVPADTVLREFLR